MDLSRRSGLPPLILFITFFLCVQNSQSRFFGERLKRQNGANMYLSASSIIPGGEGDDPNEWTEWSSPSECSRSCGGGVSFQTRECLRTAANGAPICQGGNRKYFSCNTQDCPEEETDFRAQQCSRFNHQAFDGIFYEWVPYTNAPNPCELNCMPKGERFYYRHKAKVIDGTRCNDQDLDVCVDGQCQPVGCDMMLGSDAKEDNCRKCGGDGRTCRTISDKFTTNNLAAGYNDILLVPSGATNIRIQETAPSNNYLSCRNLSSHYYLNGNWRIDFPRPMFFAGSWWNYQRKPTGFAAPDQLSCRGPITESIFIVMLVQDKNVSIEYEYSIPRSVSSNTPDVYTWTHMEYGPCSATCGGGTQTRAVTCNNRFNLEEVDPSFCDEKTKPAESQACATEPCAPHWTSSEWGKCSKGCGSDGVQNRTVTCERISPTGERTVEDDSVCLEEVGNKPANQQECNRDVENCPKYHLGPWSPCDKLCGEGKQRRKVTCYIEENGRKKVLSDDECIEDKPETEKACMLTPCEGVDWILSQWSGCNECGQTVETRTAICASKSGKVYDDEFCAPETPLLSRPCESKKCKTQWFTSEWSKCSSSCGKGIQSRVVLCGEFDGKTLTKVADDSQCDASSKPEAEQECEGEETECPGQWFTGPWEPCSKSCGGGERQREVLCLANGTKSTNCDESKIESLSEKCNTQACTEDEVLPVDSTDKPVTDEEYEDDCDEEEEEEEDYIKLVTDKMSEDLKISDGIDLDEESTMSSLMTDDLMLSDSTQAAETTDEELSTDLPLSTIEGSGDQSESTDLSSIATEGSGDDTESTTDSSLSTEQSGQTDDTTDTSKSSETSSSDVTTESLLSTDVTEVTEQTETSDHTDSSTDSSESVSTDVSTDSSTGESDTSETTDQSTSPSSTDISETTELSSSTSVFTDASDQTDSSITTDVATDMTESTLSTDISTESKTSESTTDLTDTSQSTSDSTESSISTESTTESSTESSVSTDSTTDISTESSVSTSTDISSTTVSSSSTDSSVSTEISSSTDISTSTDVTTTSSDDSTSSDGSTFPDSSLSTEVSPNTDDSTSSTDSSVSTDLTTDSSVISESPTTDSTESSLSTDLSTSTDKFSDFTDSSSTSFTDTDSSTSTDSGISVSTDSSSEAGSDSTDVTTETGISDETTDETFSEKTTSAFDSTTISAAYELSTLSDIFDSTTESSGDTSLSTDEFTTIDIWATEDELEKSTPNTLEAAITKESKPKKCKPKKPKDCQGTTYGCCPDGKHIAKGPFDKGCPIAKTCDETEFGCCHDGVSPATGKNFKGCPKSQCAETLFGCCPDKYTPAEGEDNEGCPEPTTLPPTTTTEIPEETTDSTEVPESSEVPVTTDIVDTTDVTLPDDTNKSCSFSEFGCCPDGKTVASGKNFAGCEDVVDPKNCRNSLFGCCYDGRTSATGPDYEGCPSCTFEPFGCCPDNETPAHGHLGEGCCLNSQYGCCPDNINSARGPNFEDCDCKYAPYGCCPDNKTSAFGPNGEGCGCESSEFGCCPDKLTAAQGPKFQGCPCHTLQFGCCPDGITIAQGPHHYGCHCSQTEFKCCPDEKTPAKGPENEGCTCLESKYGCCPDGITSAKGDKFEGCENVKEPPQLSCKLPKETGPCGNFSIKYFFDTSYGACAKFWYGGCDGNGNRFDTESECKETCQDFKGREACLLPKSQGPCTGYITKWYFDAERGRCEEFKYGGCYGTNNRFDSLEECQSLCTVSESVPPCEQPMDQGPCEGSFERWFYDNVTDICRPFTYGGCKGNKNNYPTEHACNYHCRQPGVHKDYCSLPKKTGDCSEKHPRWHYSEEDKKCMPFYYSGCGGNKNNFPSLESCEDHCPKEVVKDICEIPAEVGECTNYQPMWYYDTKDQRCRQFYYGGCGGNENKFSSEEACLQRCENKPEPEPESISKPEKPQISNVNVCEEKPDPGSCSNYTLFWYFDKEQSSCRQFYYGGCDGNGNRFGNEDECKHQCIGQSPEPEREPEPAQPEEPSEQDICLLSHDTGNCDNYTEMWYFDAASSICSMFYYGGCGGNGNRFASEEECNNRCGHEPATSVEDSPKCFLPVETGNCLENEVRWYYNSADGVCDQFVYTGCGGNANNYATEAECEDECFHAHETCVLPPLRGNCNESLIRWHFNENTGSCSEFEFTGCRGNRNNFVTEQECLARCGNGEPPAPSYSVCDQPLDAGECENSTTAWYYDNENMICVAFTYTGCGGNGNRFQSREQCERQCGEFKGVDVCNEDVSSGPCRQWETRYFFNKQTRTCEPFTYGGCQGTGNRFENRGECESVCIIGQEPTYSHNKDICKQQVDVGRCNGPSVTERRWYYDDARGNCISFIYSGCAGNQNNFRSYESCYNFCSKPDTTNEVLPNRCEMYENECKSMSCPYGVQRVPVDEECQRCECNNPCKDHSCGDGEQCAIEVSHEVSGQFVPVCRLINKPGICPQLRADDGVCGRECYTDADCRSDNKCCSNGCGFVCVRPTPPTIRTTAPPTVAPVVVYPGEIRATLVPKQKPELDVQTPMGGIAVLRCFATGNPAPNVTWSRNNVVVDTNQGRYVLTSSGDLTIVQVRQTDSGSYVCVASNGLGEPVRREIELHVTEPVNIPAYVYGERNVTQIVTLNRPAVVRCPAGGHPAPMVHWWRNRSRLPLISHRFELARDYSLTFRSVQLSDLGPYTCEAWNRLSRRPASIKVTLVAVGPARAVTNDDAQYLQYVIEPPKAPVTQRPSFPYRPTRPPAVPPPYVVPSLPAVPVSAVIGMDPNNQYTPGSTIAMGCSVQGYPKPNVTWIKDGLPLLPSERVQISVGEPYRLVINNISTADSGRYGCKAANAVSYSINEESVNVESTIPLNPECIDNEHFANCKLIVKGRYCKNKYYARFCCRSCALAGQL